jgi:RNA polymerase sigma factor (sigma-70 family)
VTLTVNSGSGYQVAQATATLTLNAFGEVTSDAAQFAAFRHGPSQMAFQQLVDRHQPAVLRTAFQILGNRSDAEDISQLVFLALARQEMTIHSSLQYWLQKVTRNASIALLRAKSRRLRHEVENAKPAESPSIEIVHELQDELQVAMERLPGHLSEAVRLRYLEGWSQQEAAAIVGCPRGTLSQRASQGLQSLREMLVADVREAG